MAQGQALGVLEIRGMVALTAAVDVMLKAADVQVCGRHGIGSGWVTVVIQGEVAAVQTALQIGQAEGQRHGQLIVAQVIPRPAAEAMQAMPHASGVSPKDTGFKALGMLETQGLAPLIQGADALVKAADVELAGWAFIGGALCHLVVRGDVAAVQTAITAGRQAAERLGPVVATLTLPQPADGIGALLPPPPAAAAVTGALGVLETTGYVGAVAAADALVKAADVEIARLAIGSGGRSLVLARGPLDAVKVAIQASAQAVTQIAELAAAQVISRPDPQVMACFAGSTPGRAAVPRKAMGLIETRSTVALVKAVDAMLKTAQVEYEGGYKVGYFLTAAVLRGDVGAVRAALDVGAQEAARHGELVAVHLIPYPYTELEERLIHQ